MSRSLNEILQEAMRSPDDEINHMLSSAAFAAEHYALLARQAIEIIDAVRNGANTKEWALHTITCCADRERRIKKNREMLVFVHEYIGRTF